MNLGSIPCPNCGAAWDEPCAEWCAPGVDDRANHLAVSVVDGPAGRVASPVVNIQDVDQW